MNQLSSDLNGTQSFHSKLNYFAGNIRGTGQYWKSQRNQFHVTATYHSYMEDTEANFFHTTSMAEFHDPFLRNVLSKYVATVEKDPTKAQAILESDALFANAVGAYKQGVTHYFACKIETWISSFLFPILDLVYIMLRYEFAKSGGAIHGHSIGGTKSPLDEAIASALERWAATVHQAPLNLDSYLAQMRAAAGGQMLILSKNSAMLLNR